MKEMEIEAPKVQHNVKDEPAKVNQLAILLHNVFVCTEEGKMLLELLKQQYVSNKYTAGVFPTDPAIISRFGGSAEAYCGFRSGQANVIFCIEQLIEQYPAIMDALNKPKE
jgi:hypothetical protein